MNRKTSPLLWAALLSLLLAGCSASGTKVSEPNESQSEEGQQEVQEQESTELKNEYGLGQWVDQVYTYDNGTMNYSLYIPEGYDGQEELPLITYIPDATYAGASLEQLKAAQCPTAWITGENMQNLPAIFLLIEVGNGSCDVTDSSSDSSRIVPIIDEVIASYAIDENRLYLTGQSMGGIFDFALNEAYPDKFAATVYVGTQPGGDPYDEQFNRIVDGQSYLTQNFVYITSALDGKAPKGQEAIMAILDENQVDYGLLQNLDAQDPETSNQLVSELLDQGYAMNFLQFAQVADGSPAQEHMQSFQYAYNLNSIYEWMMAQSLA